MYVYMYVFVCIYLGVELLGLDNRYMVWSFLDSAKVFQSDFTKYTVPPVVCESSSCSTSLPMLGTVSLYF